MNLPIDLIEEIFKSFNNKFTSIKKYLQTQLLLIEKNSKYEESLLKLKIHYEKLRKSQK